MHNMQSAELARLIDLSSGYISEIECGKKVPSLDVLIRYAQAFQISVSDIFAVAKFLTTGKTPTLHPKIDAMLKLLATVRVICPGRG